MIKISNPVKCVSISLVALASGILSPLLLAQTPPVTAQPTQSSATMPSVPISTSHKAASSGTPATYRPNVPLRAIEYYRSLWGVDSFHVKVAEAGVIIRFSFQVLDPSRAQPLFDKKLNPLLVCPAKKISLVVPSLENVGALRQTPKDLEAGKSYWMAFSNSGRPIKPGDRVDVVIGNFHAKGLLVE